MKIIELIQKLEKIMPSYIALSFDNVGLLIGNNNSIVTGIYVALDINSEIIRTMISKGINTIITHHPIIFKPFKDLTYNESNYKVIECIKNDINVICCHTNLDAIIGGINDELVNILGLSYCESSILESNLSNSKVGIGRILKLKDLLNIDEIIYIIKNKLNIGGIRVVGYEKLKKIRNICIINGSGNSLISYCFNKDIDLVITGDITYHTAFEANENNLSIIDIGHFNSENNAYKSSIRKILKSLNIGSIIIVYDDILKDVFKYML